MTDATDRTLALAELLRLVEADLDPVLTTGAGGEVEAFLDQQRRATRWAPNTFYRVGDVVLPTVRNGRRYRCSRAGVSDNTAQTTIQRVSVTNAGSGYTSQPAVSFSGGGGSGAAAVAIVEGGLVVGVFITDRGSGYTSQPAVSFSGGGGTGAAATASISGAEPAWPLREGAGVTDGDGTADGVTLRWAEDGPDFANIYDVRAAAAACWWEKARKSSDRIKLKLGDHSADEQLTHDRCVAMAKSFAPVSFW